MYPNGVDCFIEHAIPIPVNMNTLLGAVSASFEFASQLNRIFTVKKIYMLHRFARRLDSVTKIPCPVHPPGRSRPSRPERIPMKIPVIQKRLSGMGGVDIHADPSAIALRPARLCIEHLRKGGRGN